ncbi:MAG: SRPBCC domain-containing protein [Mucilaginibacter sp.]|nr:SRPBCC domain-containing protein [Mucilaginibacter sp.]
METIAHQVWIGAGKQVVYKAVTTAEGLSKWWIKDCTASPTVGFVNIFRMNGEVHDKMRVIDLKPDQYVEWECINDNGLWTGTHLSFEMSEKQGICKLNFKHSKWPQMTEFFTVCNFHWARHLLMLKAYCEMGDNQLFANEENKWGKMYQILNS